MCHNPQTIEKGKLAVEALKCMKERNISCLVVAEDGKAVGMIRLQDIIQAGIIG